MLTVWGRKTSSNVQALMWCIGELNLEVERHDVGHVHGGTDTPEFLAINPNGTIPVLRDGDGEPLWETGAILRYLAGRYGDGPFWPRDDAARACVDKWADWAKINVATNFTRPVFWQVARTAPQDRKPDAIAAALAHLDRFLDIAEQQLSRDAFIAGGDLTLADIQLGHVLFRHRDRAPAACGAAPLLRRPHGSRGLPRARDGLLRRASPVECARMSPRGRLRHGR